jgi:hypothetical protein
VLGTVLLVTVASCSGSSSPSAGHAPTSATAAGPTTSTTAPLGLGDPTAVATTLTTIERQLRVPGETDAPTLGPVELRAYDTLESHPDWRAGVLAAIPPDVHDAVNDNLDAATALDSLTTSGPPVTTLPSWTIRAPMPEATLLADYHEAEAATGIPWAFLAGIHLIESRLGRIMGPSSAGAQGPMQFEPATWQEYGRGGNIDDDHDAILAAGRLLAANGGPGNMTKALLAYNNDSRYARAVADYATVLLANAAAFDGYYQWPVVYQNASGTYVLPVGYPQSPAVREAG